MNKTTVIERISLTEDCLIVLHHGKGETTPPESDEDVMEFYFDLNVSFEWKTKEGILLTDQYVKQMALELSLALHAYRQWLKQVAASRGLTANALHFEMGEDAIRETAIATVLTAGISAGIKEAAVNVARHLGRPNFTPFTPSTDSPRTRRG